MHSKKHINRIFRATATLLLLLLCVCSAVARDTTRVFYRLFWDEDTASGANGLGGGYTFDYQYDGLYRLTSSTGTFAPNGASYGLEMDFTPAGRVCRKFQDYTGTGNVYAYSPNNKPHAVRRIYNGLTNELSNLLWDANGNLAQIAEYQYDAATETTTLLDFRNHYWNEDDRLNLVLDNSHFSYYLYGHDGQRVAKITSDWVVNWGGYGFSNSATINSGTLYLSEYMVCDGLGYTKYYYAGGTRIAARWGGGGFDKMQRLCTLDRNLTHNASDLFNAVVARIGENMPLDCPSDPCPAHISDNEEFGVQLPTLNFETGFYIYDGPLYFVKRGLRTNRNGKLFFFHGDQLGSANWVTLQNASPTQFLLHLPYGEEFVKQLGGSYDERFTFTGKEKDIETGYYYFGARFDNVDLGFMSVDPMSDKYPSISPYAYCAWNPVKLVDPEGRRIDSIASGLESYVKTIRKDDPDLYNQLSESLDSYRIVYGEKNEGAGGAFTYVPNADEPSKGYFNISIIPGNGDSDEFSDMEKLAHEMRHAKQFEDKQLGFMVKDGRVMPIGYDFSDEIECYKYADRYADIKARKSDVFWKNFVSCNYSGVCGYLKTPIDWIDKNYNQYKVSNAAEIISRCNSSGKNNVPYFKIR